MSSAGNRQLWDGLSEKRIQTLHPAIQGRAFEFIYQAERKGIRLRVFSALRSLEEQAQLYAKGRTAPGSIVTNAKPGHSYHNFGLALDVVEIKGGKAIWSNPRWNEIGRIGKTFGFEWGGDWTSLKDRPHFQNGLGYSLSDWRAGNVPSSNSSIPGSNSTPITKTATAIGFGVVLLGVVTALIID